MELRTNMNSYIRFSTDILNIDTLDRGDIILRKSEEVRENSKDTVIIWYHLFNVNFL